MPADLDIQDGQEVIKCTRCGQVLIGGARVPGAAKYQSTIGEPPGDRRPPWAE